MIVLAGHSYWCKSGRDLMDDVFFNSVCIFLNLSMPFRDISVQLFSFSVGCLFYFGITVNTSFIKIFGYGPLLFLLFFLCSYCDLVELLIESTR